MQTQKKESHKTMQRVIVILLFLGIFSLAFLKIQKNMERDEAFADELEPMAQTGMEAILAPVEAEEIKNYIEHIMSQNGLNEDNFAFFYYNPDQNSAYFYNETTYFTAASTVKVPVAMYYYDKIAAGEMTPETTITYDETCYEAGGEVTAETYSPGEEIPVSFLLKQSIINSDNTAVNLLIQKIGASQYRYKIARYTDTDLSDAFFEGNVTTAKYSYDIMKHLSENAEDYKELIEYMKQSSEGIYLKKYVDYDVAHKYGSYNGYIHDYGIVFGETTYLIGIFTKNVTGAAELIAEINKEISEKYAI